MFTKVLIANRGEIACRVIKTARRLGIKTVAVYSDADRGALHVRQADEAHRIGPAEARQSYLDVESVLAAARNSGAQAIHPGYGFLSENADFADAVARAGLIFIGPPAQAIRDMGSKSQAKAIMEKAGVPLVPGYHGTANDDATLAREAKRIGYPLLVKAAAGGGGRGMRVVADAAGLPEVLAGARRESRAAFGDDTLLLEKYLARPRHVEIQVFADSHGNAVYLFERDCSLQRRHQKVVEEAPAPGLSSALRRRMGEAAVAAARAVDYRGAGTVEFLLDENGDFHFIEMNTRLQVEHPVTEMITGLDLVEWQFRVAAGGPLPLGQDDLAVRGHAIETRLYAEDPARDYRPQSGRLFRLAMPSENAHVRVETGVAEGDEVGIHYDPMIAKLVVWDEDRPRAVRRLQEALGAVRVAGVATNQDLLMAIARHPAFAAGEVDTGFIPRHGEALLPARGRVSDAALALACLGVLLGQEDARRAAARRSSDPGSPWNRVDGWRLNGEGAQSIRLKDGDDDIPVMVRFRAGAYLLNLPGGEARVTGERGDGDEIVADIDGARIAASVALHGGEIAVFGLGPCWRLRLADPFATAATEHAAAGTLIASMPGKIVAVKAVAGAAVRRGEVLVILEAMKMEHSLAAPADGEIEAVHARVGGQVAEGDVLVSLRPSAKDRTDG